MLSLNYISLDDYNQAINEELNFQPPQNPIYAPHFVMYVRDLLVNKYGLPLVEKGGLECHDNFGFETAESSPRHGNQRS